MQVCTVAKPVNSNPLDEEALELITVNSKVAKCSGSAMSALRLPSDVAANGCWSGAAGAQIPGALAESFSHCGGGELLLLAQLLLSGVALVTGNESLGPTSSVPFSLASNPSNSPHGNTK